MQTHGDESSHRHPEWSEPTSSYPLDSTSVQDSSSEFPILQADLINEILLKLPVKSLVKFKCVSKSWLHLISSPKFVKSHLSISANNKGYTRHRFMLEFYPPKYLKDCSVSSLLNDHVTRAVDLDCPMEKSQNQSIGVVGSVNGLICLSIAEKDLFLWNPSIRKFKKLPPSLTGIFYAYGFGYDELHDDYKVVGITQDLSNDGSRHNVCKIYSLMNNSWEGEPFDDFQIAIKYFRSGMFVNGKLHWANISYKHFGYNNDWDIISVDLADGRWGEMEKPCYGEGNFNFIPCLGMLQNDLCIFCHHLRSHADVWVMKEYGVKESWTKMFSIKYAGDPMGYSMFSPPFCMSSEGEFLFKNGSFMIYNPNDDSMRSPNVTNCDHLLEAKLYIESLVWPFISNGSTDATTSKAAEAQMKTIL
ncbi:unnamed protein product [Withania somnifera]